MTYRDKIDVGFAILIVALQAALYFSARIRCGTGLEGRFLSAYYSLMRSFGSPILEGLAIEKYRIDHSSALLMRQHIAASWKYSFLILLSGIFVHFTLLLTVK